MNNVLIPKDVLQKVIQYLWVDEQDDYEECVFNDWSKEDLEEHIFCLIKQLQDCIDDQA
jgi:hypothetical protein